ncbi:MULTISPECIES: response regulator transcription factor [unclassified Leifsonia]|uniref:response regulator transcription factor n=1 Tax=unclassified Leifsonia TaxID=2663824 RepID=UPI0006F7BFF8|nr:MULTISPECIES: response regulator transcription factor [unclassified Leifsonia]KQX06926.1 two-component system response regulator [Leifsonia sp. Root1293]KRA11210.1 two-component system response regulator [Leifsonia sp. Root60]
MRILIVEDDPSIADGMIDALGSANYDVEHVSTGAACLDATSGATSPDLIVLDLGLPDMDGTDVCRRIRETSSVPIVIVSARSEELDRVLALELGADDYLVKPFGLRELLARIRAIVRRTAVTGKTEPDGPDLGPLVIDTRAQRVSLAGSELHLTPTEFELLRYLASDPGAVRRRSDILRDVWHTEWYGATKTLDAHIAAVRRKLGDPRWIESVRGVGFRFEVRG